MKTNPRKSTPPRSSTTNTDIPLFHSIKKLYTTIYRIGNTLPKRDKLGIHHHIEIHTLELFDNIIAGSLVGSHKKIPYLEQGRLITEKIKHLVRMEYEMQIIKEKNYIQTAEQLVEISKMINGWISYIQTKPLNE